MHWSEVTGEAQIDPVRGTVVELRPGAAFLVQADSTGRIALLPHGIDRDHTGQPIDRLEPPVTMVARERAPGSGQGAPNQARLSTSWDATPFAQLAYDAWLLGERADGTGVITVLMLASEPRRVQIYRLAQRQQR
jgi:hypothetical protein